MRPLLAVSISAFLVSPAFAFEVSSPSVSDGKWDNKYIGDKMAGCDGQNVSIALNWKDPPARTKSFMLTMYDPDALGNGVGWWHWQVWNIRASVTGLPEGADAKSGKGLPKGAMQGKGDLGRTGYLGPCPSPGTGPHRYMVTLYAMKEAKLHYRGQCDANDDGRRRNAGLDRLRHRHLFLRPIVEARRGRRLLLPR